MLPTTHLDQQRASSRINDNYCVTKLQTRLLVGSPLPSQTIDNLNVKFHVVSNVYSAPGHSQKKELSPGSAGCYCKSYKLKSVKSVSCVTQLSCVQPVTNVQNAVPNLPVGARLKNFGQTWLDLGASPKVIQILKEGYTLPFRIPAKAHKVTHGYKLLCQFPQNSYLLEALHQLIAKNAVELVKHQTSLGFFNRLFLVPKPNNKWRPILDLSKLNLFLKTGDPGNHQNVSPTRGVGYLNRFPGHLLPYTNTGTVQEISEISCPRSDIPIQSTALWSVHSTLGVHCDSKRGETDGHTQGYKNPPVPRRLVGESHIPPGLSPAYSKISRNMSKIRLAGEFGQVGAGSKTGLRFCRIPIHSPSRSGPTDPRPVAEPSEQNLGNTVTTDLSGPAVHVPDWFINSHREASSPRPATHETHTVAPQKPLENTRISRKGDPNSEIFAPSFTMVATGKQRSHRPTITPNNTCFANLYRRIKRRVGRSLKRTHCQRDLVTARKQTAYKLFGTQGSVSRLKRVSKPLYRPDSTCGNRQHYRSCLHKQGRGFDFEHTLCPTVENLDLVYKKSSHSQSSVGWTW